MPVRPLARLGVLILCLAGCASGPAPSDGDPAPTARRGVPERGESTTPDPERQLLERALEGFGGADRVDRLRTVVVESRITRSLAGRSIEARQRSWVEYPYRFRREVELQGITIASVISPDDNFIVSSLVGVLPLPEAQRVEMERSLARSPLSLLKGRRHESFTAIADGEGEIDGGAVDYLHLLFVGDSNRLAIDRETGRVLELAFTDHPLGAPENQAREVVVRFGDFRDVDGLVYPFVSEVTGDGEHMVTVRVDWLRLDEELDPDLFLAPAED